MYRQSDYIRNQEKKESVMEYVCLAIVIAVVGYFMFSYATNVDKNFQQWIDSDMTNAQIEHAYSEAYPFTQDLSELTQEI